MTRAISAGKSGAAAALISAAMLEPRPEIRMATRRFMVLQREIEVAVIDDAMLAFGRDHLAELRHRLAGVGEDPHYLVDGIGLDDRDHTDAAVEGAQHFELGDPAPRRQPFEHGQDRQTSEIDTDAEMLWQHARNVVGETAAGDVGQPLHRASLADRA